MVTKEQCRNYTIAFINRALNESQKLLSRFTKEEIDWFRANVNVSELTAGLGVAINEGSPGKARKAVNDRLQSVLTARRIRAALGVREIVGDLDNAGGPEHMDPWTLSKAMFRLGVCYGELSSAKIRATNEYQTLLHSTKASSNMIEARYWEDREDYSLAMQEAEDYWEEGGRDLHHMVAKRLAKKYGVNEKTLKKRLAPIAHEKYGRCSGYKGVKKSQ